MKRTAKIIRDTKETQIKLRLDLDGSRETDKKTGLGFFDHMIDSLARHSNMDLSIQVKGDLHVDDHHTIEDTGICLGQAILEAVGDKKGINRFGWSLCPMDEALARCALDFSGRPFTIFESVMDLENVENLQGESVSEFFRAVATAAQLTLHLDLLRGENTHHAIEILFKAFAQALKQAKTITGDTLPSTKGIL